MSQICHVTAKIEWKQVGTGGNKVTRLCDFPATTGHIWNQVGIGEGKVTQLEIVFTTKVVTWVQIPSSLPEFREKWAFSALCRRSLLRFLGVKKGLHVTNMSHEV